MEKSAVRQVYSRGNSAETPNWRFTLSTQIPREQSPELCERLGFIVIERGGGHYYYPDYKNNRMAAAFEWYQPYKGWKFGYKFGVEFWVEDGNLEQMGAYALYGEDHPKHGSAPEFNGSQQSRIERNVIGTIQLALEWKDKLSERDFYAVHYLQLQSRGVLKTSFQIPSLDAVVLPTVQMGKENARVSAVVQRILARSKEEAKILGQHAFSRFCALLTLAVGQHHQPYRSTLGKTALRQFVHSVSPIPSIRDVYPARKYKESTDAEDESARASLKILTDNYSSIEPRLRRTFDNSLFAYYTAKELLAQFPTVASVALIAALKPFRATGKCPGAVTCSLCGNLGFRHDNTGEAASISATLGNNFGFAEDDGRRTEMREMIKHFYRTQRSSYVHDAVLRHGEFGTQSPDHVPDKDASISERLKNRNHLISMDLVVRRALLRHAANLAGQEFDPEAFGIERERFKFSIGSSARISVGSKYWVGIRAMGALG